MLKSGAKFRRGLALALDICLFSVPAAGFDVPKKNGERFSLKYLMSF